MSETTNLQLPFIETSQAQKHVTYNDAIRKIDVLVQVHALSRNLSDPPSAPQEGDIYVVANGATGDWQAKENHTAAFQDGAWAFQPLKPGIVVWLEDESVLAVWDSSQWVDLQKSDEVFDNLGSLGINATADSTNKLSVSSSNVLFNHDGGDIRHMLNKNTTGDTASFLFQTGFSGRAEIGLTGDDDFHFKVSPDGVAFFEGIKIDKGDGVVSFPSGMRVPNADFGAGEPINTDYIGSRGLDLVTNGSGLLGNNYNMPALYVFDASLAPNLPGAFYSSGYYSGVDATLEFMAVDPNKVYRLENYLLQDSVPGDWSAFANGERHLQYAGLICYDIDKQLISAPNHMRYWHNSAIDSLTTLSAPLTPGETTISVVDAAGWNETSALPHQNGIIIFGHKNSFGFTYDYYSKNVLFDLFEMGDVNKTTNLITLNKPLPTAQGNPDDVNGTWPVGTGIANSDAGASYKYSLFSGNILPAVDTWYRHTNFMGGIDVSGRNVTNNFPPGTAFCKFFWLSNFSNRVGGWSAFPDTGPAHKIRYSGISVTPSTTSKLRSNASGSKTIFRVDGDIVTGNVSFSSPALEVEEV